MVTSARSMGVRTVWNINRESFTLFFEGLSLTLTFWRKQNLHKAFLHGNRLLQASRVQPVQGQRQFETPTWTAQPGRALPRAGNGGAARARCPLHHSGAGGDGEALPNQRPKYVRRRKPLSKVGITCFLASRLRRHPVSVTKGSAPRPGFTGAEAGSTGCIFWVQHGGAGDGNPQNGERAYASAPSHKQPIEFTASYRGRDVNWRGK